jgi:hypothetical protein
MSHHLVRASGLPPSHSRPEAKDEVEGRKKLGPPSLPASQELGRSKIFQIFVIGDHVNRWNRTLEVPTPGTEHFKDSKQFLVVGVVFQLGGREGPRMEGHRTNFSIG